MTNFELGYNGYKNGLTAPAQCKEWIKSIEGVEIGEDSGVKEWLRGWYKGLEEENKRRFPEMYQ